MNSKWTNSFHGEALCKRFWPPIQPDGALCWSEYDGIWWLINGMPMTICCWCIGIWLLSWADIVLQGRLCLQVNDLVIDPAGYLLPFTCTPLSCCRAISRLVHFPSNLEQQTERTNILCWIPLLKLCHGHLCKLWWDNQIELMRNSVCLTWVWKEVWLEGAK